jgi:hypothetical protein
LPWHALTASSQLPWHAVLCGKINFSSTFQLCLQLGLQGLILGIDNALLMLLYTKNNEEVQISYQYAQITLQSYT